jgi:hypothetical protein
MSGTHTSSIEIPKELFTDVSRLEQYYRTKYPGIQIRMHGLMFGDFPHPKRIPYITLLVDGCGNAVGASLTQAN